MTTHNQDPIYSGQLTGGAISFPREIKGIKLFILGISGAIDLEQTKIPRQGAGSR
jgi:hypothetical protein